jgi:hypothetical protein
MLEKLVTALFELESTVLQAIICTSVSNNLPN